MIPGGQSLDIGRNWRSGPLIGADRRPGGNIPIAISGLLRLAGVSFARGGKSDRILRLARQELEASGRPLLQRRA